MTPEEQRIAIAEACGWKRADCPLSSLAGGSPDAPKPKTYWLEVGWNADDVIGIPDYLNDLNAMHEAEKSIMVDQREFYLSWLGRITEKGRMAPRNWTNTVATAVQRAEAFLRTIGKWKDV